LSALRDKFICVPIMMVLLCANDAAHRAESAGDFIADELGGGKLSIYWRRDSPMIRVRRPALRASILPAARRR
jgi:hypothetical protein